MKPRARHWASVVSSTSGKSLAGIGLAPWAGVRSNLLGILQNHGRSLLADHDRGSVGVAADHLRHDGRIHHPEATEPVHPEPWIHHGVRSVPHAAGADGV